MTKFILSIFVIAVINWVYFTMNNERFWFEPRRSMRHVAAQLLDDVSQIHQNSIRHFASLNPVEEHESSSSSSSSQHSISSSSSSPNDYQSDDYDDDHHIYCDSSQDWPTLEIYNNWDDTKYTIDFDSTETSLICMEYWSKQIGYYEWLQNADYMTSPLPNVIKCKATEEMQSNLSNMHAEEKDIIQIVYEKIVMQDETFLSIVDPSMLDFVHNHIKQPNVVNNPILSADNPDARTLRWKQLLEAHQQQYWSLRKDYHHYVKKGPKKIAPLTDPDNPWYPGEGPLWMDRFVRMICKIGTFTNVLN